MTGEAILVTGAAGFLGFHVARRLLARGDRVIGLDSLDPYYDVGLKRARLEALGEEHGDRFAFREADLSEPSALNAAVGNERIGRIVHLAAQAGVRYSLENPLAYGRANLIGHLNMLELARREQATSFVYASSSSVYGAGARLPFRVSDPADHPLSLYAATKRADELMSESYAHLFAIPQTGLRFFTIYGPWGRPDMAVWKFTEAILEGQPIILYNHGRMKRDFTFVDDAVSGVVAALDRPPADSGAGRHVIYNLGAHRSEPLERLVAVIEAACGKRADIQLGPMHPGDAEETFADISPAMKALDFSPSTPIDQGIPRFVEWYRAYRSGVRTA